MDMNGINSTPLPGKMPNVEGVEKDGSKRAPGDKSGLRSDRVELSDEARQLLEDAEELGSARETVLKAARERMLTGDLLNQDALRRAAEKLLDSGDLEESGDA